MDFLYQYDPVRDTSPVRILSGGGDFGGTLSRYDINNAYREIQSQGYEGSVYDFTRLLSQGQNGRVSFFIDVENTISYEQIMYYKLLFSEFSALGFIPELIKASKKITFDFDGYDWGRTGNILGVGGLIYTGLEKLVANDKWWIDAKGAIKSTKLLEKLPSGKFVVGVQGYRNGFAAAAGSAKAYRIAGKVVGVAGVAVSGLDMLTNGVNISNSIDMTMSVIGLIPGGAAISSIYFVASFGSELITGKSISDHIQDFVTE